MISLDCFACKGRITAPDDVGGRSGKCPKCGAILLFPSANVTLTASPPPPPAPEIKRPKPLKKIKFAKKKKSRLPFYMACGALGLLPIVAIILWAVISMYLEHSRTRQIQEQELAELQRRRALEEKQGKLQTAQQELDQANLKFRQEKLKKDQEAQEDLDRQNRELKQKREQAAKESIQGAQSRFDQQMKEARDKEKAIEDGKRREAERKKQQDMIEEDHKTILAYGKIYIKTSIKDPLWSPPLRAVSVKEKDNDSFVPKQGLLYRLQGVVGQNRKPVSYYFFLVNREVVRWQPAKGNDAVTICKIIGDLELP